MKIEIVDGVSSDTLWMVGRVAFLILMGLSLLVLYLGTVSGIGATLIIIAMLLNIVVWAYTSAVVIIRGDT